jgi:protein tyrosine phosphatase (PTP) superfamily phosphohydrolase (DUF442 family)
MQSIHDLYALFASSHTILTLRDFNISIKSGQDLAAPNYTASGISAKSFRMTKKPHSKNLGWTLSTAAALTMVALPGLAAPSDVSNHSNPVLPKAPMPAPATALEAPPAPLKNDPIASLKGGVQAAEQAAANEEDKAIDAVEAVSETASSSSSSSSSTMVPSTSGQAISSEIGNFEVVSKGLWRGAQPSHQAVHKLAQSGVKTIIDLRYAGSGCSDEADLARQLGINYINIPLGFEHPSMGNIAKFLAIVAKPANQPVFVHCRQGADRTGTLVGIFRIMHDHWTFSEAYNEMRKHHFKPWLNNMKSMVARCEGNSKLSKELTEMASHIDASIPSSAGLKLSESGASRQM